MLFNGLSSSNFWTAYKTPSKVFDIPQLTGTDFEILWTLAEFTFMAGLLMLRVRSYLELVFVSVLFELFEATRVDHVECLDARLNLPDCF